MRRLAPLVVAVLLFGLCAPVAVMASSSLTTSVAESFDGAAADWYVASGPGSITTVTSPRSQGSAAMQVAYSFTSSTQLSLSPRTSAHAPELAGLPRRFSVDVDGDGSWNVLYLQVRDATGEIFHYKLGNISFSGWSTLSVEPGRVAPATTLSGNGDGILDLPVQVYRLVLDKNPGGTKTTSSVVVDNLTYTAEAGSALRASSQIFVPSAGQATTVSVDPQEAGAATVRLTDEGSRVRTFSGAAAGGGAALAFAWNGRADDGSLMTGSVRARLSITRAGATWTYGVPYLAGLPARYESASPGSIAGINSRLTELNTVDRASAESQSRLMEGAWLRRARESFSWNRLEPRPGWYEWAKFDQAVEVARAHHVDLLGRLEFSADWASSAPSTAAASTRQFYPPSSPAAFAAYARAVVHRYKDRVHVWEIWNEENSATFWKPAPSASAYAALLKTAYAAIKAEDPSAIVLLGGTVGFDKAFLDGIGAAGAWSSFDGLAIHEYVAPNPETSMFDTWLQNARAYVDTKGPKPLWITEFGWSTYTGSGSTYIGVSETTQASYTARAYLLAAQRGVSGIFAYELVEHGTSTSSKLDNYGLVEVGGRQKPAYAALRRVAEPLDGGTVAGMAAPAAAQRKTIASLDSLTGWKVTPLGGGSASIALSTTRHGGTGSMRLAYAFTSTSQGVELSPNLAIAGTPTMVSAWVSGDGSANPVYIKIADATGETFQGAVGSLQKGWQRLVLFGDGKDINWTHSGGDGDGRFDYPITLKSLFVFRGGIGTRSGTAYIDDIQVDFGARVRGVLISRRGAENQALYLAAGSATLSVPVPGTPAYVVDGSSSTAVPVTNGAVSVTVGSLPINVLSGPSSDPGTISPSAAMATSASPVTIHWLSGDRTRYAFQVLNASNALVRTLVGDASVDAGLRSSSWDGLIGGNPAPTGTYRLRICVTGPDGRVSYLLRSVTVQ